MAVPRSGSELRVLALVTWPQRRATMSNDELQIDDLIQQVVRLYQQGLYEQALSVARKAYDVAKRHFDKSHPDFALTLNYLAMMYYATGDYPSAESLYKQALTIYRTTLGEDHPDF